MRTTAIFDEQRMYYETPREGISIGGYIARRMHKTIMLKDVPALLAGDPGAALAQIALYAAAASTSFGRALYQPTSTPHGALIRTTDPQTGAQVNITCEDRLRFGFEVEMKNVGRLTGSESISGTTLALRGLVMPAPTRFKFVSANGKYTANMIGIVHSELAPRIGGWRIRGYGALDLSDNAGNHGRLTLDRSGQAFVSISGKSGEGLIKKARIAGD